MSSIYTVEKIIGEVIIMWTVSLLQFCFITTLKRDTSDDDEEEEDVETDLLLDERVMAVIYLIGNYNIIIQFTFKIC